MTKCVKNSLKTALSLFVPGFVSLSEIKIARKIKRNGFLNNLIFPAISLPHFAELGDDRECVVMQMKPKPSEELQVIRTGEVPLRLCLSVHGAHSHTHTAALTIHGCASKIISVRASLFDA